MSHVRTALVALSVLTLLVAGLAGGVAAQEGPVVENARQVTADPDPTRTFPLPQIAVHPDNPQTAAIAVAEARTGGCSLHVTTDGGRSWRAAIGSMQPEGTDFCVGTNPGSYLDIAFASDGTLYVAFFAASTEERPEGGELGVLLRTDNLGATHELSVFAERHPWTYEPDDGPAEEGWMSIRNPRVAVHPTDPDLVYVTTQRRGSGTSANFREADNRTHVVVSGDGGRSWSEPTDLTDLVEAHLGEDWVRTGAGPVAVGPDGTAYVIVNGEDTFFLFRSTDRGESWDLTEIGEGSAGAGGVSVFGLDAERGHLYLVWHERRGEGDFPPSHVYLFRSTDLGETWGEAVNLTADGAPAGFNQYHPGMSVAPDGRVDVAWYDYRNDPGVQPDSPEDSMGTMQTERYWDVYTISSRDGGETWSEPLRATDRSVDAERGVTFSHHDVIGSIGMASTEQTTLFAWGDTRAGDDVTNAEDVYFTQVRFAEPTATGAPVTANGSLLWTVVGAGGALTLGGLVLLLGMRSARRRPVDAVGERVGAAG